MQWLRFDAAVASHPKLIRAGAEAAWLWVAGIGHCNMHATDGRIAKDMVALLYPPLGGSATACATRLVEVGLWHDCDAYYLVHDYEDYQADATKAEIDWRREYEQERRLANRETKTGGAGAGGKVYFIRAEDRIKIAFSKNPWARLEALKSSAPSKKFELIGHIRGTLDTERDIHKKFSHLREDGQWFVAARELLSFIAESTTTGQLPDIATGSPTNGSTTHARAGTPGGAPAHARALRAGTPASGPAVPTGPTVQDPSGGGGGDLLAREGSQNLTPEPAAAEGAPHSGDPDVLDDLAKAWHRETGQALAGTEFGAALAQLADAADRERTTPVVVFGRAVAAFVGDCTTRGKRPKHTWLISQLSEWLAPAPSKSNGGNGHPSSPVEAEYIDAKREWDSAKQSDDESAKARALERFKRAQKEAIEHAARKAG